MRATDEFGGFLETYGPHDVRPAELRAAAENVRGIADELATAQEGN